MGIPNETSNNQIIEIVLKAYNNDDGKNIRDCFQKWNRHIQSAIKSKDKMSASAFIQDKLYKKMLANFYLTNDIAMLPFILCGEVDLWGNTLFNSAPEGTNCIVDSWLEGRSNTTHPYILHIWVFCDPITNKGQFDGWLNSVLPCNEESMILFWNVYTPNDIDFTPVSNEYLENYSINTTTNPTENTSITGCMTPNFTMDALGFDLSMNPESSFAPSTLPPNPNNHKDYTTDSIKQTITDITGLIHNLEQTQSSHISVEDKFNLIKTIRSLEDFLLS